VGPDTRGGGLVVVDGSRHERRKRREIGASSQTQPGWLRPQWVRGGAGGGVACWGALWRRSGGGRGGALARGGDANPNLWRQRGRGGPGRARAGERGAIAR